MHHEESNHTSPGERPGSRAPIFRKVVAAAAILLMLPWGMVAVRTHRRDQLRDSFYRAKVEVLPSAPDGVPRVITLGADDLTGKPLEAEFAWKAYGESDEVIAFGEGLSGPSATANLPGSLAPVERLEVTAARPSQPDRLAQEVTVPMGHRESPPMVHLTSDRPLYRPGETALLRVVILNRLTNEPLSGRFLTRVTDPKGAAVATRMDETESGVLSWSWSIPEDSRGGRYHLELRSRDRTFAYERLPFEVRRYSAPLFAKIVRLSRRTYAPGERGAAALHVERVTGETPIGAQVRASVLVDGESVWSGESRIDSEGNAGFTFDLPTVVERGEGRFVAQIQDAGALETVVEPFVIPAGSLTVKVYPEGGTLVAEASNRVYVEVMDSLGRPVSGSGRLVDTAGVEVTRFSTEHLGRGGFKFTPLARERYSLELDGQPRGEATPLPVATATGARLAWIDSAGPSSADVRATVEVAGAAEDDEWTAALFCRGKRVAESSGRGPSPTEISLSPDPSVAGVLRLTLFNDRMEPIAERLVHRQAVQRIAVTVSSASERTVPGAPQVLSVTTRDENGEPVAAVVGLSVTDRASREEADVARIGLEDQAGLFADMEWDGPALEERGELLAVNAADDEEFRRRVDLLLGTRGWRRFAWVDREATLGSFGDRGKRLLAREGYADTAQRHGELGDRSKRERDKIGAASAKLRRLRSRVAPVTLFLLVIVLLTGVWRLFTLLFDRLDARLGARSSRAASSVTAALCAVATLGVIGVFADRLLSSPRKPFGGASVDMAAGLEADDAGPSDGQPLGDLGTGTPGSGELWTPIPSISAELFEALDKVASSGPGTEEEPRPRGLRPVRVYAHSSPHTQGERRIRDDFEETVYWNSLLRTGDDGRALVSFDVSDRPTTWEVFADAHGAGRLGQGFMELESVPPLRLEARLPVELTEGDRVSIPVAITADRQLREASRGTVRLGVSARGAIALVDTAPPSLELEDGKARWFLEVAAQRLESGVDSWLGLGGDLRGVRDRVVQPVRVVPLGFPITRSQGGLVGGRAEPDQWTEFTVEATDAPLHESSRLTVKLYPSPLAGLSDGGEGLFQLPYGCFEQTSSINYPNVLVMRCLDALDVSAPALRVRAREALSRGYRRLTGFECSRGGFDWFGEDPGHGVLTAYGLVQFTDMAKVFPVDPQIVARTSEWLLERRDGRGGFAADARSGRSFRGSPVDTSSAYCTYALALGGFVGEDLAPELRRAAAMGRESSDPYVVALCASALEAAGQNGDAQHARTRLKAMQRADGSLIPVGPTITSSGARDAAVETTALAALAWLADPDDRAPLGRAMAFLAAQRQGSGRFGSTQATVMSLRAVAAHAKAYPPTLDPGEFTVILNGEEVGRVPVDPEQTNVIELEVPEDGLRPGPNRVRLELSGGSQLPWAADFQYRSEEPADSAGAPLALEVQLDRDSCSEGETVGLDLAVQNLTADGLPMPMAIIGLPASLECPTKVLNDLKAAGRFDFWERRGRELIFYWRDIEPEGAHAIHLDLIATLPGTTTGPASRAYLYYTDDLVHWATPLRITVAPKR